MSSVDPQPTVETPPVVHAVTQHEAEACANCGTALHGRYCMACGQRSEPLRQPIGRFLKASIIEFLGVDGRLWRSMGLLLFRPGRLTKVYLAGQRVRYIRPLRLYLIASLSFFFLLTVVDPVGQVGIGTGGAPADTTLRVADYRAGLAEQLAANAERLAAQVALVDSLNTQFEADSLAFATAPPADEEATEAQQDALDDLLDDRDDERRDLTRLRRRVDQENQQLLWSDQQVATAPPDSLIRPTDLARAAELLFEDAPGNRVTINLPDWWPQSEAVRQMRAARTSQELNTALAAFARDVMGRLPTVMFLLLPVFALLLKLLYLRRGWYYSEHLVFGLHTHGFAFVVFTLMLLAIWAGGGTGWTIAAAGLPTLLIPIYFYIAQKRVYRQGWFKTALKAWVLGWMYLFVLSGGFALALLLAAAP